MPKSTSRKKPAPSGAPAPKKTRKSALAPFVDIINNMDPEILANLRELVLSEFASNPSFLDDDPVELFADYLKECERRTMNDDERADFLDSLVSRFTDLRINANGGDRRAREKIKAVCQRLNEAIAHEALSQIDLVTTGKIFSDAGWNIPETLKQALAKSFTVACRPAERGDVDVVSPLLKFAEDAELSDFDLFEHVKSIWAALPTEACVALITEAIGAGRPRINRAMAGFILHADAEISRATAEAFAKSAKHAPVESLQIERLVLMRPWLPPARQAPVDAAIRAMRLNSLSPAKSERATTLKCYASVCDGSGARNILVTQKIKSRYRVVTALMKSAGVVDAMSLPELSQSDLNDVVLQMRSSAVAIAVDMPVVARMLALGLADNLATETPPPFKLVETVEHLGLGQMLPDHTSPGEIISALLADLPGEQTDAAAAAKAHASLPASKFNYQWFEAGEELERLLQPIRGTKRRVAKVMREYLPARRGFWTRQCALSALAMRGCDPTKPPSWKQLALVGRDIAADVPLDQIPLMKQIAELSVRAFENQL